MGNLPENCPAGVVHPPEPRRQIVSDWLTTRPGQFRPQPAFGHNYQP